MRSVRGSAGHDDSDADRYYRPFELACLHKSSKIKAMALDAIEKLIGAWGRPGRAWGGGDARGAATSRRPRVSCTRAHRRSPLSRPSRSLHAPPAAFGYLRGSLRVKHGAAAVPPAAAAAKPGTAPAAPAAGGGDRFVVDIIVEAVCSCRDDPNDSVQLQVIKALLTGISSPLMAVREQSLLLAVRAVYHVYLTSRNAVNKNTAKATLRQIMNIVFQRMESWAVRQEATFSRGTGAGATVVAPAAGGGGGSAPSSVPATPTAVAAPTPAPAPAPPSVVTVTIARKRPAAAPQPAAAATAPQPEQPPQQQHSPWWPNMYDEVAAALGLWSPPAPVEAATAAPPAAAEVAVEPVEERRELELPAPADAAEAPALPAGLAGDGWAIVAVGPPKPAAAAAAKPPAAAAAAAVGPGAFVPGSTSPDAADLGDFPSQYHRDAFLLFRALCRLSMRGDEDPLLPKGAINLQGQGGRGSGGGAPPPDTAAVLHSDESLLADPVFLQSKLLALELVLATLEGAGPALRGGARFIASIKAYLCVGLLKNLLSSIPPVAGLSLKVFLALMRGFRRHVAPEVEVFISTVFLRILHSPHSSFDQKMSVLTAFRSIASEPGALLELFLNYDCSEGRGDLFEPSVMALASIAQGRTSADFNASQKTASEATAIRGAALQALSQVLQSIVVTADLAMGVGTTPAGGEAAPAAAAGGSRAANGDDDKDDDKDDADAAAEHAGGNGPQASPGGSNGASSAPAAAAGGGAGAASSNLARQYDEAKRKRALWERAAIKFAVKPKNGIAFLTANGLCDGSAGGVAAVFHDKKDVLDKTSIGDYMGAWSWRRWRRQLLLHPGGCGAGDTRGGGAGGRGKGRREGVPVAAAGAVPFSRVCPLCCCRPTTLPSLTLLPLQARTRRSTSPCCTRTWTSWTSRA
jgi:hypothetical protein